MKMQDRKLQMADGREFEVLDNTWLEIDRPKIGRSIATLATLAIVSTKIWPIICHISETTRDTIDIA